jgi:hypothetical protein
MTSVQMRVHSAFIEPRIITKPEFEKIPNIHGQREFSEDETTKIGDIFRAHGVCDKFSLQLLHRHFDIPDGAIVLTEPADPGVFVSKVTPIQEVDLLSTRGQLYYLNDEEKFQAYEYEYGPPVDFSEAFLKDLIAFIQTQDISDRFALASTAGVHNAPPMLEWEIGSQATVTVSGERAITQIDSEQIKVNWKYSAIPDAHELGTGYEKSVKTGNHSVLYMAGSCSALSSDEPFDFKKYNVVEVLRANGFIH